MTRLLCLLSLLLLPFLSQAKEPAPPLPLPPGTPVQFIRDMQGGKQLVYPQYYEQGLLGMAVLGSSMRNHEIALRPVFTALAPADLDGYFLRRVMESLAVLAPGSKVEVVDKEWTPEEIALKTRDSGGLYVAVRSYHAFAATLDSAGAYVEVWIMRSQPGGGSKSRQKVVSYRNFAFEQHFQGWTGASRRGSVVPWLSIGTPALEQVFRESIDQASDMLAYHLGAEGQSEAAQKVKIHRDRVHGLNVPGRLVRTGSDWFWFRTPGQKQLAGYGIIQTGTAP